MVAVKLLIPEDLDELALNLNGKKRKLSRQDFDEAMSKAHIPTKAIKNLWKRIENGMHHWEKIVENSFLNDENKVVFIELVRQRVKQIDLKF